MYIWFTFCCGAYYMLPRGTGFILTSVILFRRMHISTDFEWVVDSIDDLSQGLINGWTGLYYISPDNSVSKMATLWADQSSISKKLFSVFTTAFIQYTTLTGSQRRIVHANCVSRADTVNMNAVPLPGAISFGFQKDVVWMWQLITLIYTILETEGGWPLPETQLLTCRIPLFWVVKKSHASAVHSWQHLEGSHHSLLPAWHIQTSLERNLWLVCAVCCESFAGLPFLESQLKVINITDYLKSARDFTNRINIASFS
jgi:hypothetical protein